MREDFLAFASMMEKVSYHIFSRKLFQFFFLFYDIHVSCLIFLLLHVSARILANFQIRFIRAQLQ